MSWTCQELVDFCNKKSIPSSAYSFYKDKDDAFCFDKIDEEWIIYYSERGSRIELAWAKNEDQALNILKLFLLESEKFI